MNKVNLEEKVRKCLKEKCHINIEDISALSVMTDDGSKKCGIGVAVSGGADSVCLLIALCNICNEFSVPVKVISVNHFIRSDEETCGDVLFVQNLCKVLKQKGFDVECFVKELKKGQVSAVASERKMGIEEAARFLRYELFDQFVKEMNLCVLCLAHNKNDFYETVLMRFLQGASCDSSWGIAYKRDYYVRPLMDCNREEIEAYLGEKGQNWRTDKTNFDDAYFRNKVRGKLIPFLDENFEGWKTAIEAGSKKDFDDSAFICDAVEDIKIIKESDYACYIDVPDFFNFKMALKNRLLLKMCNMISERNRVPYKFLCEVCDAFEDNYSKENKSGRTCVKYFADIKISLENNRLYVRKNDSVLYDFCFSDIIEETGFFEYDWGVAQVLEDERKSGFVNITLKYNSGREEKLNVRLPYQLIINQREK